MKKPVALVILDGVGIAPAEKGNAVKLANTPNLDQWRKEYPTSKLIAHGEEVGLPKGQMGNSEVGHLNIGAGRIVYQSLSLINKHIKENTFKDNLILNEAINHAKRNNSIIHIFGLVSDGGVHSHQDHIIELSKIIKDNKVKSTVHAFTDGRDTDPSSAKKYIKELLNNNIDISSISGRYYAMDRDKRWERTQKAFDVITNNSDSVYEDILKYINESYDNNITDEFIIPAKNKNGNFIKNNDVIIFANFRPDRARQLSHLFIGSNFEITNYDYKTTQNYNNLYYASLMEYEGINSKVLFPSTKLPNILGPWLEKKGLTQMRAAETEKYPHVTFFFDGGEEIKKEGETRILVPSPKVATYDLQPEMSCENLTNKILENVENKDVLIINFAQPDMVGHTGIIPAVIKSVEIADKMLKKLYDEIVVNLKGTMIITADHGNAEEMLDKNDNPVTKHTTNLVEIIITDKSVKFDPKIKAKLANLAPTILKLLKVEIPNEMEKPLIN